MAASAFASFTRICGIAVDAGTLGPWQALEAAGNATAFALLVAKLARPKEPLTRLYVVLPQFGFLIEVRADAR